MTPDEFIKLSRRQAAQVASYINDQAPAMVARKTLRFIDGNFRAQGWQGATFQRWKPINRKGRILIKTGRLRRGVQFTTNGRGEVLFYNNVKYAKVHNEGFEGEVTVRPFTRARYAKGKVFAVNDFTRTGRHRQRTVTNKVGESGVRGFTRKMKIQQRQFMPYEGHESPVLNTSILREIEKDIRKIFKI
jgi:phage gpG-like protein